LCIPSHFFFPCYCVVLHQIVLAKGEAVLAFSDAADLAFRTIPQTTNSSDQEFIVTTVPYAQWVARGCLELVKEKEKTLRSLLLMRFLCVA
jgi:hypothetical protein